MNFLQLIGDSCTKVGGWGSIQERLRELWCGVAWWLWRGEEKRERERGEARRGSHASQTTTTPMREGYTENSLHLLNIAPTKPSFSAQKKQQQYQSNRTSSTGAWGASWSSLAAAQRVSLPIGFKTELNGFQSPHPAYWNLFYGFRRFFVMSFFGVIIVAANRARGY